MTFKKGNQFAKGKHPKKEFKKGIYQGHGFKKGNKPWNKEKKLSENHKSMLSKNHADLSGSNHPNWQGGITSLTTKIRTSLKYKQWRSEVFTRDKWICQTCNKRSEGDIEAHHIKEFSKIIKENNILTLEEALKCLELWNINNGVTLCLDCHNLTKKAKAGGKK